MDGTKTPPWFSRAGARFNGGSRQQTLTMIASGDIVEKERAQNQRLCVSDFASQVDLGRAVGVSASYGTCLSDIPKVACNVVLNQDSWTPFSCTDVIILK